jgi:hypothetical protein
MTGSGAGGTGNRTRGSSVECRHLVQTVERSSILARDSVASCPLRGSGKTATVGPGRRAAAPPISVAGRSRQSEGWRSRPGPRACRPGPWKSSIFRCTTGRTVRQTARARSAAPGSCQAPTRAARLEPSRPPVEDAAARRLSIRSPPARQPAAPPGRHGRLSRRQQDAGAHDQAHPDQRDAGDQQPPASGRLPQPAHRGILRQRRCTSGHGRHLLLAELRAGLLVHLDYSTRLSSGVGGKAPGILPRCYAPCTCAAPRRLTR